MSPNGFEAIFVANRDKLFRFAAARVAGDLTKVVQHDVSVNLSGHPAGRVRSAIRLRFLAIKRSDEPDAG